MIKNHAKQELDVQDRDAVLQRQLNRKKRLEELEGKKDLTGTEPRELQQLAEQAEEERRIQQIATDQARQKELRGKGNNLSAPERNELTQLNQQIPQEQRDETRRIADAKRRGEQALRDFKAGTATPDEILTLLDQFIIFANHSVSGAETMKTKLEGALRSIDEINRRANNARQ